MSTNVILVCGYSGFLLAVAYGFDFMARRVSVRAQRWRTGSFRHHPDHDAWTCPQDQWLWPTAYDAEQRVVRYRGKPAVCNACPVKDSCTTSPHGREVTRQIDPWPHSEAGRFHRGIACWVALIAIFLPLGMLASGPGPVGLLALLATIALVGLASVPLARHLWRTPSGFPDHIPQQAVYTEAKGRRASQGAPATEERSRPGSRPSDTEPKDRFATRWGSASRKGR